LTSSPAGSATDETSNFKELPISAPAQSTDEIREAVRERYAAAAVTASGRDASCCGTGTALSDDEQDVFGAGQYAPADRDALPEAAQLASLGCGNPTAVADLHEGETVLDLGSRGGIDVLLSAQRVGPSGKAYGLDMTDEMLALARENAERAGATNVEFVKGEAARVLRPGGRLAFTDVVADPDMDDATRADMAEWTGCIAGALTVEEFERELGAAGLVDIDIRETHRVHDQAGSAIVRARKPSA
jgi:SAM-dependent methyltransferase